MKSNDAAGATAAHSGTRNGAALRAADAFRADAIRFRDLVTAEATQTRVKTLFAQGLQTRGPLELNLGDRLGDL
ncbi:hypothetical protein [Nonomuraea sp. NPDC049607]|uniref:hypothetical protein n=1 Tax=Nonomuraea sp. NPDC049607 TaxID=3154732 RepID=UPI0034141D39